MTLTELIQATHKRGVAIAKKIRELTGLERALEAINRRRRARLNHPITMYDSTEPREIPPNPEAVAGYVGGHWPTYPELVARFPKAKRLSIAVNASENANCLDIESGDATPAEALAWCDRQHNRGVRRPCLYANLSTMPAVKAAVGALPRSRYRLWVAHYTYVEHLPEGYDACQWTDEAHGRNLDRSICKADFFD